MWHIVQCLPYACFWFLLTHPVWDVTPFTAFLAAVFKFLLTHPVWDVTKSKGKIEAVERISTHTSRVGCDYSCENIGMQAINFYSHIPCGMWRPYVLYCVVPRWISTHTSRVGCDLEICHSLAIVHISTHTSRVGCDLEVFPALRIVDISTHTSRVGCDPQTANPLLPSVNFYSHIPCGMWPLYIVYFNHIIPIYYRMDL